MFESDSLIPHPPRQVPPRPRPSYHTTTTVHGCAPRACPLSIRAQTAFPNLPAAQFRTERSGGGSVLPNSTSPARVPLVVADTIPKFPNLCAVADKWSACKEIIRSVRCPTKLQNLWPRVGRVRVTAIFAALRTPC